MHKDIRRLYSSTCAFQILVSLKGADRTRERGSGEDYSAILNVEVRDSKREALPTCALPILLEGWSLVDSPAALGTPALPGVPGAC